jgi:hypothetical protein
MQWSETPSSGSSTETSRSHLAEVKADKNGVVELRYEVKRNRGERGNVTEPGSEPA